MSDLRLLLHVADNVSDLFVCVVILLWLGVWWAVIFAIARNRAQKRDARRRMEEWADGYHDVASPRPVYPRPLQRLAARANLRAVDDRASRRDEPAVPDPPADSRRWPVRAAAPQVEVRRNGNRLFPPPDADDLWGGYGPDADLSEPASLPIRGTNGKRLTFAPRGHDDHWSDGR